MLFKDGYSKQAGAGDSRMDYVTRLTGVERLEDEVEKSSKSTGLFKSGHRTKTTSSNLILCMVVFHQGYLSL